MGKLLHNKIYNYTDYVNWPENEKIEIIEGNVYAMAPAPLRIHQRIVVELATVINNYIKAGGIECEVYVAPFDVRLCRESQSDDEIINVVQPDISVICDKSKLDDKGCKGSPDMIIEVVSSSNAAVDYIYKLNLYNRYKVKEYWIINPRSKTILAYKLGEDGQYSEPETYNESSRVKVEIFSDLTIDFSSIFE